MFIPRTPDYKGLLKILGGPAQIFVSCCYELDIVLSARARVQISVNRVDMFINYSHKKIKKCFSCNKHLCLMLRESINIIIIIYI